MVDPERERQYDNIQKPAETAPRHHGRRTGLLLASLVFFFILGSVLTVMLLRGAQNGVSARVAALLLGSTSHSEVSAPVVVDQIRRLNRLETVSFSVDTVVQGERTNAVLPDLLFGDRLLMVVHGEVLAGVDLQQLKPEAVHIDGKHVTVDLPPSQIFTTRIDEAKTKIFARSTGVLAPADPNLETDTRRIAENQVLASATADGILDTARSNARGNIESLLHGLGFEQVEVR